MPHTLFFLSPQFPVEDYAAELRCLLEAAAGGVAAREAVVAELRRSSSSFTRGASRYRGVTRHPKESGKWEARVGRVQGGRYLVSTLGQDGDAVMDLRGVAVRASKHSSAL